MNPYTKPNPEQDKTLQAITAILKEDGHNTHQQDTAIHITTKTHHTFTITIENDKIHIHPANIQKLTNNWNHPNPGETTLELANPNCFQQIKEWINNTPT